MQRSQGNAFYVEELVGAFLGGGWSLPEDLADLLLVRLDRLDEPTRDVVRVASAAGQRVPHDLLARVAPVTEDQLEVALRHAIDANVLVRTGDSEYAFRHALLGEAVYDDLLPGERMRLHTAYAEAVRELHGRRQAANLARHALASHDLPTALLASVEAGDQAMATGGPDEAARHYTKALEIYTEGGRPPRRPARRGRAGRPHRRRAVQLGPPRDRARPDRLPPPLGSRRTRPPLTRARLLLARVEALRSTETDARPSLVSGEALELVGPEPTQLRARILSMHAQALIWDGSFDEARRTADEAIELADLLELPTAGRRRRGDADLAQPAPRPRRGQPGRAQADHRRGTGTRRRPQRDARFPALRRRSSTTTASSRPPSRTSSRPLRLAREIGRPWTIQGIAGRMQGALMAYMRGEWDEALAIADYSHEDPPPTPRAMLEAVALAVAAGRGEVSALSRFPALRERWHREGLVAVNGGAAAMELQAIRDGAAAAVATYDDISARADPALGRELRCQAAAGHPGALAALADEAPRTSTAARDDVRATAARLVADAERRAGRARRGPAAVRDRGPRLGGQAACRGATARVAARRHASTSTSSPAGGARAAELFAELGHVFEEARARARLALVLRAAGDAEAGQAEAGGRP